MSMFDTGSLDGGLESQSSGIGRMLAPLGAAVGGKSTATSGYLNLEILADRVVLFLGAQYDQITIQTYCVTGAWLSGPTPAISLKYSGDGIRFDSPSSPVSITSVGTTVTGTNQGCTGQQFAGVEVSTIAGAASRVYVVITATKTT